MKSQLTRELKKYGFMCGIELTTYVLDTGKYTTLVIEGHGSNGETVYRYDFYKQTFYTHYPNKVTVYGEKLSAAQLLKRVYQYFIGRENYIAGRKLRK